MRQEHEIMENIGLKKILTHENKGTYVPAVAGLFLVLYTVCGAISNQYAVVLPMPSFERNIPFLPWTIWVYIVAYPVYIVWSMFTYRDEEQMNRTLYGFVILMLIACVMFLILPVTYPRSYYPLPPENDLTTVLFKFIRTMDKPSNCFPSMHVGICYLLAMGFKIENKRRYYFALFTSTVISLSTLTTKQHYIYDIIAGYALAIAVYYFFSKKVDIKSS